MADDLLSLGEAAALTGLSASHLRLLASRGRIKAKKVGRNWITTEAAVRAYLADRRHGARGPYRRRLGRETTKRYRLSMASRRYARLGVAVGGPGLPTALGSPHPGSSVPDRTLRAQMPGGLATQLGRQTGARGE